MRYLIHHPPVVSGTAAFKTHASLPLLHRLITRCKTTIRSVKFRTRTIFGLYILWGLEPWEKTSRCQEDISVYHGPFFMRPLHSVGNNLPANIYVHRSNHTTRLPPRRFSLPRSCSAAGQQEHNKHTTYIDTVTASMASGPPSSIDIGDGYGGSGYGGGYGSASSSLTYYEKKFGGYGGGGEFDPTSFIPSYTPTDKGEIAEAAARPNCRGRRGSRPLRSRAV